MNADAERLFFEGNTHLAAHDHARAEACFREAVATAPLLAEAHANLGWVMAEVGAIDEAEALYRRALALSSDHVQIRMNYGAFLARLKKFDAAQRVYLGAIDLEPAHAPLWSNLGSLYTQMALFDEAEASCLRSLTLAPDYANARINLAYLCLRQGRFEEGFEHFEWRTWQADLSRQLQTPRWDGEALAGRSIVVGHEGGYGDMIQFCRYASLLKQKGAGRVTLLCPSPLLALLRSLENVDEVMAAEVPLPPQHAELWVSLMSLPQRLGTRLESIPAALPYLRADPAKVRAWQTRLPVAATRIGLAWRGNPKFENDADRSLPSLAALHGLAGLPGVVFVSLQKGVGEDRPTAAGGLDVVHLGEAIETFADTAAVIENLDLVISVDTAAAHLAGALGKACWLLLPRHMPDWRWLHGRTDSPWYPGTLRLFSQDRDGDWESVVRTARDELEKRLGV